MPVNIEVSTITPKESLPILSICIHSSRQRKGRVA